MVGFYSYNPPKIYEALQAAGKLGQITVIAFDEDPITLGAVRDGSFAGTVVQQPFEWGYQGMKLMAEYLEGDKSGVPENKLIIVPTKVIDKANVDQFEADLKARDQAADTVLAGTADRAGWHCWRISHAPASFRRRSAAWPSRSWNSSTSPRPIRASPRSTASAFRSPRARSSAWSARTAPANRR